MTKTSGRYAMFSKKSVCHTLTIFFTLIKKNSMTDSQSANVQAGAQVLSAGIGAVAQGTINRKTRKWNEKMYNQQKADALENWNRQNAYNSPEAQMARLQEAGLNPNLVYGNGTVANSSSAPDTPHAMPYKPQAPELPLGDIVQNYFNVKLQQQRLSNEKTIGTNMQIDGMLKMADLSAKDMLNKYMAEQGYTNRGYRESTENMSAFEKYRALQALNFLNFGGSNWNDGEPFAKDSMYSTQMESARLLNKLRSGQVSLNTLARDLKSIDLDFSKRIKSGSISELNSAEILRLIMEGFRSFK